MIEVRSRRHPSVRFVIAPGDDAGAALARAERELENLLQSVRRKRRLETLRKHNRKRLARPGVRELERARKARWRADNPEHVNDYYRRYDAKTPGRREYKAAWLRNSRKRQKAGRPQSSKEA